MKAVSAIALFALAVVNAAAAPAQVNGCAIRQATLCLERDLRTAALRGADLARADFRKSDLSGADLSRANLISANLELAKLNRANLAGADLSGADLKRAELYGANLRDARLSQANFHSADLNGAVLDGARLDGANLSGADLPGASLRGATLVRTDLSGAVLSNADLRGADLSGASFRNATLTNADLTGARIEGASFDGANMRACVGCPAQAAEVQPQAARSASAALEPATSLFASSAFAQDDRLGGGCWARLYREEQFRGRPLTLVGPIEVENVGNHFGFPWEPLYESLQVGPSATLVVYDNTRFRNRSAVFKAGKRIGDLDDEMGVFRSIRSVRVTCS